MSKEIKKSNNLGVGCGAASFLMISFVVECGVWAWRQSTCVFVFEPAKSDIRWI